jgi:WD40 repeat protein
MDKTARLGKMVLAHDSYVRSIAIMDELVVTGCEDEDVWVWDGDRLVSRVTGHCAGVTCLQVWKGHLISGGLDATVRFWTRQGRSRRDIADADLLHPRSMATAMTEEEERELEELLE